MKLNDDHENHWFHLILHRVSRKSGNQTLTSGVKTTCRKIQFPNLSSWYELTYANRLKMADLVWISSYRRINDKDWKSSDWKNNWNSLLSYDKWNLIDNRKLHIDCEKWSNKISSRIESQTRRQTNIGSIQKLRIFYHKLEGSSHYNLS